ncbi:unnamed protein product [Pocillopora meandrina]|uniref:Uncharacterized protein n=1 Tax=Pocillopora meandrina TaxID=46732 RepID=A0AAU9XMU4_9CNID|nr:unnamed protein product [Pocillopora meandrina]
MAVAPKPNEIPRLTNGRGNLYRRRSRTFGSRCPPVSLPPILKNQAIKKLLKAAKPQRDCLDSSPGAYGKSKDFDDDLQPHPSRHRVGYSTVEYRSQFGSSIADDFQFLFLWREISEALVTTAGKIHPSKRHDWQAIIDKFLDDLLNQRMKDRYRNCSTGINRM